MSVVAYDPQHVTEKVGDARNVIDQRVDGPGRCRQDRAVDACASAGTGGSTMP